MIIDFIAFSKRSANIALSIRNKVEKKGHIVRVFVYYKYKVSGTTSFYDVINRVESSYKSANAMVFISSCSLAVKAISRAVRMNDSFFSVAVLDEDLKYSISLVTSVSDKSENLASIIADASGAEPVITSQSGSVDFFTLDEFIAKNDLYCDNKKLLKEVRNMFTEGTLLGFSTPFAHSPLPQIFTDNSIYPYPDYGLCIDVVNRGKMYKNSLFLYPKLVTLGLTCQRDISTQELENSIFSALSENAIPLRAIEAIATTESRRYSQVVNDFGVEYGIPVIYYSPEEICQRNVIFRDISYYTDEEPRKPQALCEKCSVLNSLGILIGKTSDNEKVQTAFSVRGTCLML